MKNALPNSEKEKAFQSGIGAWTRPAAALTLEG
jgi:hypothetical protein